MPTTTRPKRGSSKPTIARKKRRSKKAAREKPAKKKRKKVAKRKPAPKRKPPPKRKPAPKRKKPAPKKKRTKAQRSAAAKKGAAKKRKKKKLLDAMADMRMQNSDQPAGWIQRRAELRITDSGVWRRIAVEYSEEAYTQKRLATLEQLEIDFLNRGELHDYLEWVTEESGGEIQDLSMAYRMYLGYDPNQEGLTT